MLHGIEIDCIWIKYLCCFIFLCKIIYKHWISHPAWRWSECQRLKVLIDDEFDGFLFSLLLFNLCIVGNFCNDLTYFVNLCVYCLRRILITSYSILKIKPSAITFVNQIIINLPNYTFYGSSTSIYVWNIFIMIFGCV